MKRSDLSTDPIEQIDHVHLQDVWRGVLGQAQSPDAKAVIGAMALLASEIRGLQESIRLAAPDSSPPQPR